MPATDSTDAPETHLYLIRHGQAVVNVSGAMGGMRGDTGLTALGRAQAERLRDRLATGEIRADVLIASSLPRARETAAIVAPALGLPVLLDDDLQELRVADECDGLPFADYVARYGWVDLAEEPLCPVGPGGESWAAFMLRAASALERIAHDYAGKTAVVVTHGGIVDASLVHFLGLNAHEFPRVRFRTANTSLTHWSFGYHLAHGGITGRNQWQLDYYNDYHHLSGIESVSAPTLPATAGGDA